MVRREVSVRSPRGDRLGMLPRLAEVAEEMGWTASYDATDGVVLARGFEDEAAATAALQQLDEILTQIGSFSALVR